MAEDLLERLKAIDLTILTDAVRQDQNDPSFEITTWDVKRLSDKGIAFPDGLWIFSGTGGNDSRPWSIVLKILMRPKEEPAAINGWSYWKREFAFVQSELSKHLPTQSRAPRIYHTEELPDGCWMWMEHVTGIQMSPWTLDDYAFAAHQLGLWNGSYLTGTSLPAESWFAQQHYRSWLAGEDMVQSLQSPLNQKYISQETMTRFKRLWNERETFFNVLENLPQVFSHFDTTRRNLMISSSQAGQRELVLLDWGQCGIGAIGAELTWLTGFSAALLEWPLTEVAQLDEITFPSYIRGLNDSGWSGDADLARLGFTSMFAVYIGCALPGLLAWWCLPESKPFAMQQFNLAEEELYRAWLPLIDYSLERADEALSLMKKLGYG